MWKFAFLSIFLFGLLQTVSLASIDSDKNLENSSVSFAINLYKNVLENNKNKNIVISPLSLETVLKLLYNGAGGETAKEILEGLKLQTNDVTIINNKIKQQVEQYKTDPTIQIANKIYVSDNFGLRKEYLDIAVNYYNSEVEAINFRENVVAADIINNWVVSKTNGKIDKIVVPGDLGHSTRAVLLNAIHFKGDWVEKFRKSSTSKKPFWITSTESVEVDMMRTDKYFFHTEVPELDASTLKLRYRDTDISLLIFLPNELNGLDNLETKLQNYNLLDIDNKLKYRKVDVSLPKFKIEMKIDLNEILSNMGIKSVFEPNSDLSNLSDSGENLAVSKVIQKAFIEVNEEGTEAAAATVVEIMLTSSFVGSEETYEFNANHPFLYVLRSNNDILFIGRYTGHN